LSYGCITFLIPNCVVTLRVFFADSNPRPQCLAEISLVKAVVLPDDAIAITDLSLADIIDEIDLSSQPESPSPFVSLAAIFTE
jgi:hypothetical protein